MRNITIKQIEYFIAVAECRSFTAASEKLFVAQSSLSSAVREVEEYYHIEAFERGARGVTITNAGQELYIEFKSMMNRLDYLKRSVEDNNFTSSFCVATQHHICGLDVFVRVLNEYSEDAYRCGFHECTTSEMLERVSDKSDDIGIVFFSMASKDQMIKNIRNKGLIFNHLCYRDASIYLHKSHPLAGNEELHLEELVKYPYLTYDRVPDEDPVYTNVFETELMLKKIVSVRDRASAYTLLHYSDAFLVGTGISSADTMYQDIIAIPIRPKIEIEIGYIMKGGKKLSAVAERFVELLKQSV